MSSTEGQHIQIFTCAVLEILLINHLDGLTRMPTQTNIFKYTSAAPAWSPLLNVCGWEAMVVWGEMKFGVIRPCRLLSAGLD
jgi:hypothetical protein